MQYNLLEVEEIPICLCGLKLFLLGPGTPKPRIPPTLDAERLPAGGAVAKDREFTGTLLPLGKQNPSLAAGGPPASRRCLKQSPKHFPVPVETGSMTGLPVLPWHSFVASQLLTVLWARPWLGAEGQVMGSSQTVR